MQPSKNSYKSPKLLIFNNNCFDKQRYDSGDKTYQCARHIDILKFWIYWKHYGTLGLEKLVRDVMDTSKYFA